MKNYLPPKVPLTPAQAAERRARVKARILSAAIWIAIALPLVVMTMAFGYSDQAPAALRSLTMQTDSLFGSPVWALIGPKG
jgi:hypothetical protein